MSTKTAEILTDSNVSAYAGQHKLSRNQLAFVFILALTMRAGWGMFRLIGADDPTSLEFPDETQYWLMAENLHNGEGLRDEFGFKATRMPLYPAWLSLFTSSTHGVIAAKVCQWIMGALVALLAAGLATTTFDHRVGLIAGIVVALDPFLTFFSSLLLTETPYLCAEVAMIWCAIALSQKNIAPRWWSWFGLGVLGALCIYLRESSVAIVGLVLLWLTLSQRHWRPWRPVLLGVSLAAVVVVISLLPWAWRNAHVTGDWCMLTHRGGVSLYDGVGPQADGSSNLGDVQQMSEVLGMDEVEWNRYFMRESWRAIFSEPGRVARLIPTKLARLWNPLPNVETYQSAKVRAVSALWTLPVYILALAGVGLLVTMKSGLGVRVVVFLLLPAIATTVLHSVFVGSVRYRLIAMPLLEILAAYALVYLYHKVRGDKLAATVQL